ncbi:ATP-binding protein [Actinocorallia sp. A-T 12471]|uniref:ATP-binding protein n=1 Tax=Actinocorallia sp. A-T 12471 TaxID=3089813 RepID=UPI0029CEF1F5|nr:ATP-binding protein [Actinocorallia sp. A-T 12471]MDX6740372.1 ATP-binding protein [Actinocorallia sp. A-T 12471]
MSLAERDGTLTPEELRGLFLFESLDDEQLGWIAEHGWTASAPADTIVMTEGEPGDYLVLLLSGTIALSRRIGVDDVETNRTDQVGVYAGAVRSYIGAEQKTGYPASVKACSDCRFFVLPSEDFAWLMRTWFPMATHLLEGLFLGLSNSQTIVNQRQQLLALGSLSAGLTHELNNPAAAAVRATSRLRERVEGMRHKLAMLAHGQIDPRLLTLLVDVQEEAVRGIADAPQLSAVEESEREDEIADWLEDHDCGTPWETAPIFVAAGLGTDFLDRVEADAPPDLLEGSLRWLAYTLESELLLGEITDSVNRISGLIQAAKQYSHMDRSPFERADIHTGLESTLVMLNGKLEGLEVVTDFDRTLPPVPIYAGELNQVWTNLIDNAVQAMHGSGTLTIRTARDGDRVRVDIADTGPGIPEAIRHRIFEPFFTTKPVGQGTGLGLDISYRIIVNRHGGDLTVTSTPGHTLFSTHLPLTERPPTQPHTPQSPHPPAQTTLRIRTTPKPQPSVASRRAQFPA